MKVTEKTDRKYRGINTSIDKNKKFIQARTFNILYLFTTRYMLVIVIHTEVDIITPF